LITHTPPAAIIVLTFNQKEKTIRCLTSLQNLLYDKYKIFLWDNGSVDGTVEAVQKLFPEVITHYSGKNLGVAGGRNSAVQFVNTNYKSDFYLFLDNDTVVEPDFLTLLVQKFSEDKSIGITTAKIKYLNDHKYLYGAGGCAIDFKRGKTSHRGYGELDEGKYDNINECISSGGCLMVRKDAFSKLNGFDEIFNPYGPEDIDFVLRGKKLGYKSVFVSSSIIYHDPEPGHSLEGGAKRKSYTINKAKKFLILLNRHARYHEKLYFYFISAPLLIAKFILRKIRWTAQKY
jgi:GT2 family glycosyltransferase